jgi:hypothetical protein
VSDFTYVSRCRVDQMEGLHRHARLASGESFDMGVHGPVVALYQLSPDRERPLPVDYIVAAAGG